MHYTIGKHLQTIQAIRFFVFCLLYLLSCLLFKLFVENYPFQNLQSIVNKLRQKDFP